MELDNKKVTEIFLGLILIIVLIILIFLFTQQSKPINPQTIQTTPQNIIISNSYNVNSYNQILYKDYPAKTYYKKDYYKDGESTKFTSQSKKEIVKGIFQNKITRYVVYVKNTGDKARYFKVQFKFEDCYEKETYASITKCILPNNEEKFTYTDIKNQYCNWNYEIS